MTKLYFILLILSNLLLSNIYSQPAPKLVKSFGMLPGTFAGKNGVDLNGKFVTDSLGSLLISDGTDTGTYSIVSGFYNIEAMVVVDGKLFFIGCDTFVHGNELWISNGTASGTHLVKEINPLPDGSGALYFGFNDYSLIAYNHKVYFYGNDGVHGVELWRSDGTDTGTAMIKDINTNPGADILDLSNFPFGALQVANNKLFFAANDGINGPELWCTDGSAANTYMVKDIIPGAAGANPQYLTALNNKLCFWTSGIADTGLYITDGTDTGTHLLASHILTPNSEHAVLHNKLYFFADSMGVAGSSSLWVTDGTAGGTSRICHAFYGTTQYSYYSYISSFLTTWNNKLYFGAADHLWVSDGTAAGTAIATNFSSDPGLCCTPTQILNFGGKMYMRVMDFNGLVEICSSNGTDTGTRVSVCTTADFTTGSSFVIQNDLTAPMTMVGTKLFFWNTYEYALGHSLYTIDLAPAAITSEVANNDIAIYPNPSKGVVIIDAGTNNHIRIVEVYDLTGHRLSVTDMNNETTTSLQLPASADAMLVVKIYTDKGILVKKLLLQ